MLLDKFFRILEEKKEGNSLELKVELIAEHDIFKGHFPGDPIVPGVCQIQMLSDILTKTEGKTYFLSESNQIKFVAVIKPTETPTFHASISYHFQEDNSVKLTANFFNGDLIYFKMKGTFRTKI